MPTKMKKDAAVLIIAGGQGSRFWPASRQKRPKPLFHLDGKNTLLAETIKRHQALVPSERIFVIVPDAHRAVFKEALRGLLPEKNLLVEPEARGTAVAIAYGCALIEQRMGEVVIAVAPADHHIEPNSSFRRALMSAFRLAASHPAIVLLGVRPTRPETGYGYLRIGRKVGEGVSVARFVEKPTLETARRMLLSGRFLWNVGVFVMSTKTLAAELAAHAPALAAAIPRMVAGGPQVVRRSYARLHFNSFDYTVVEKSSHVLAVPAEFRWNDVGSWHGMWEATRDSLGNALFGNVLTLGAKGVLAHSPHRLMVLLGVDDLVAVDAGDAILITKRSRSQEVRAVIDELKRRRLSRYL